MIFWIKFNLWECVFFNNNYFYQLLKKINRNSTILVNANIYLVVWLKSHLEYLENIIFNLYWQLLIHHVLKVNVDKDTLY